MKKIILILTVVAAICVFSSCASQSNGVNGMINSSLDATISLRGEETHTVYFGIFGEYNYPPFEKVARDNGINKIATVERYYKVGVFGIWIEYTTIVTGIGPGVPAESEPEEE